MKLYKLFFISITWLLIAVDIIQARAGPRKDLKLITSERSWSNKANRIILNSHDPGLHRNRSVVDTVRAMQPHEAHILSAPCLNGRDC